MVLRQLRPHAVKGVAPARHGPLRQLKVVGRERHRRDDAFKVDGAFGLSVQREAPFARLDGQSKRQLAVAVAGLGGKLRQRRPFAHQLHARRMAKRRLRGKQLDTLHHVRLPNGVRANQHGKGPYAAKVKRLVAAEIPERDIGDAKVHAAFSAFRRCEPA